MRSGKRRTVERTDQLAVVTAPDQRMPPQSILLFESGRPSFASRADRAFLHGMPVRIGNRTGTAAGTASRTGRRLGRKMPGACPVTAAKPAPTITSATKTKLPYSGVISRWFRPRTPMPARAAASPSASGEWSENSANGMSRNCPRRAGSARSDSSGCRDGSLAVRRTVTDCAPVRVHRRRSIGYGEKQYRRVRRDTGALQQVGTGHAAGIQGIGKTAVPTCSATASSMLLSGTVALLSGAPRGTLLPHSEKAGAPGERLGAPAICLTSCLRDKGFSAG